MSQLTTASETHSEIGDVEPLTASTNETSRAPVLITEQEVLFGTSAATSPRRASLPHRFIGAVRTAATSLRLPPPRPHYPTDLGYLERSRMAREMDRL
ncbi:hypothetical protein [Mycobacterium sp.]|uniref:hypothetical protein n=1 Tax=Mycobacterium sp. TaxID=1785 RepID=UPI003D09D92D